MESIIYSLAQWIIVVRNLAMTIANTNRYSHLGACATLNKASSRLSHTPRSTSLYFTQWLSFVQFGFHHEKKSWWRSTLRGRSRHRLTGPPKKGSWSSLHRVRIWPKRWLGSQESFRAWAWDPRSSRGPIPFSTRFGYWSFSARDIRSVLNSEDHQQRRNRRSSDEGAAFSLRFGVSLDRIRPERTIESQSPLQQQRIRSLKNLISNNNKNSEF